MKETGSDGRHVAADGHPFHRIRRAVSGDREPAGAADEPALRQGTFLAVACPAMAQQEGSHAAGGASRGDVLQDAVVVPVPAFQHLGVEDVGELGTVAAKESREVAMADARARKRAAAHRVPGEVQLQRGNCATSVHAVQAALAAGLGMGALLSANIPHTCWAPRAGTGLPPAPTVEIAIARRAGTGTDPALASLDALLRRAMPG
jgi:hypothetical protein